MLALKNCETKRGINCQLEVSCFFAPCESEYLYPLKEIIVLDFEQKNCHGIKDPKESFYSEKSNFSYQGVQDASQKSQKFWMTVLPVFLDKIP